ncbi:hypothetical protein Q8A67_022175 [Cirrhinus molitorella]|uniref:Uncharacterized protein n=1 Tax=Cirrhinus molitorella TaxID=172907 RepID=A0AA88P626_9TELE|nr:hypothetical protein Q8A67_022175 [Cirrhinus molitorella]
MIDITVVSCRYGKRRPRRQRPDISGSGFSFIARLCDSCHPADCSGALHSIYTERRVFFSPDLRHGELLKRS